MAYNLNEIERLQRHEHATDSKRTATASKLRGFYETLATQLFHQYEPTKKISARASRDFMVRLNEWLNCFTSDDDKWAAFRSIEYIFFAGQGEYEELYRCAVDNIIKPWLIEQANIDILAENVNSLIKTELDSIWPCPITDSLRINSFLHVTGVSGKSLRPDWLSLKELSCPEKIDDYKKKHGIKYLVLLEDFSGSGGQICRALKFAATAFKDPIIVIPLIICAKGDQAIKNAIKEIDRSDISYKPVIVINENCLVTEEHIEEHPPIFKDLRLAMRNGYTVIEKNLNGEEFGWKKTGSLIVLYSNCPNNTPPIFHHASPKWNPIFPRLEREILERS